MSRLIAAFLLSCCCNEDPSGKIFKEANAHFKKYRDTRPPDIAHLDLAVNNYQECLELRLRKKEFLFGSNRLDAPPQNNKEIELSNQIADTYLNYSQAVISRYHDQHNPRKTEDVDLIISLEERLFREWGSRHPDAYAGVLFNFGTVYSQVYRNAVLFNQQRRAAGQTGNSQLVADDPEQMFTKLKNKFDRILVLNEGEGGMTNEIRRDTLVALGKMLVLKHTNDHGTNPLNEAIVRFEEASRLFIPSSPGYADLLDNLGIAYSLRKGPQDLDKSIESYTLACKHYGTASAAILCSYKLAVALYQRYDSRTSGGQLLLTARLQIDDEALKDLQAADSIIKDVLEKLGNQKNQVRNDAERLAFTIGEHLRASNNPSLASGSREVSREGTPVPPDSQSQ